MLISDDCIFLLPKCNDTILSWQKKIFQDTVCQRSFHVKTKNYATYFLEFVKYTTYDLFLPLYSPHQREYLWSF